MIESAILYASCLSLVSLWRREREERGERERGRDRAEDTERELQLLMTVRSGKDDTALFDKLLFERDRYPWGGDGGFGNVSNLSKWKWQRTLQLSTSLYCGRLELKHLKVFVAKLV